MPFARHMNIAILLGSGGTAQEAKTNLIAEFNSWKNSAAAVRYKVLELKFEWVSGTALSLAIIYSE